jgi:hypothetical protein
VGHLEPSSWTFLHPGNARRKRQRDLEGKAQLSLLLLRQGFCEVI